MIFLAECARNSCYVNRWSSERRGQTDAKPRAISSLLEYCRGAKEEDEISCLDYAES